MGLKNRIELLSSFLNEDPTDAFTLYALALEHSNMDHFRESEIFFEKLMNIHPNYLPAYYHMGKLYEKFNKRELAGTLYMKGMRIAERQNDNHTFSELHSAYNVLMNIDEAQF